MDNGSKLFLVIKIFDYILIYHYHLSYKLS